MMRRWWTYSSNGARTSRPQSAGVSPGDQVIGRDARSLRARGPRSNELRRFEHPIQRPLGGHANLLRHFDLVLQVAQRVANVLQCRHLHERAEFAALEERLVR